MNDLRDWCRQNWNRIDEGTRKKCVDYLDGWIPHEVIEEWKKSGYDVLGFHLLGGGMQIRNRLRGVLLDENLPLVDRYPDGSPYGSRNWDDYYTGALDELIERYQ